MAGTLFVVATPIGNLEDITARALRTLREVALIAAEDTRRTSHLLSHYGISTPITSLHEHNERQKSSGLIERLKSGESIALVSDAGTPTLSDPGTHLIRSAIHSGLRVEPIPGPSALLAALAASGLPTETFTYVGFPPTRSKARKNWLDRLTLVGGTVVFFEAPHRIRQTLEDLLRTVGDRPIAMGRELTKLHEQLVRGPISAVLSSLGDPVGEITVVLDIGQTTEIRPAEGPSAPRLLLEFGVLTKNDRLSRRRAISVLARRYGMPAGALYKLLETAKKSG